VGSLGDVAPSDRHQSQRTANAVSATRFRGSLVSSPWINGVWWDAVDIDEERIVLRPWLRRNITLDRSIIDHVEITRVRVPFNWSTYVSFHHVDGTTAAKIFTPWQRRKFRAALIELGWIVVDKGGCPGSIGWRASPLPVVTHRLVSPDDRD
jgi:hypothetical protein